MESLQILVALSILTFLAVTVKADTACVPKRFGYDSIVCVCNATYCDEFELATHLPSGQYLLYTSTKDGLRFKKSIGSFSPHKKASGITLKIDRTAKYQTVEGFGTSFTDAAGINVLSLSPEAQTKLMRSYFKSSGIKFNMGRVPIAGCDFSTHIYTYHDDVEDSELSHFNLTSEDYDLKIPLIKWAQDLRNQSLKLKAAAWSPPIWMKTNHNITGSSFLLEHYYQTWANYHVKFLDAYKQNGLEFWAVSTGNEPATGRTPNFGINSLGWTPERQAKWIAENFGPTLRASNHSNIKILLLDDQRHYLLTVTDRVMKDKRAEKYIDGIAFHWYLNLVSSPYELTEAHEIFPSKFLISTEACIVDFAPNVSRVKLGKWADGEQYMVDIIEDFTNWVTGWIDWNMALDREGGPNWVENFVDSPVIVNAEKDEFYKQPTFYALGHFSKFVPEGSVRIKIEPSNKSIKTVAFSTPNNATAIIMFNGGNRNTKVTIADPERGYITLSVPKRSFNSLVYW